MEEVMEMKDGTKEIIPTEDNGNGKENGKRACKALNAEGQPCASWVQTDSDYCFVHDPERMGERFEARKRGGASNRAKHSPRVNLGHIPKKVRTVEDLLELLDYCKDEMMMLSNGLNRNKALVQLASTYSAVIKDAGIEDRLGDLETEMLALLDRAEATRKR